MSLKNRIQESLEQDQTLHRVLEFIDIYENQISKGKLDEIAFERTVDDIIDYGNNLVHENGISKSRYNQLLNAFLKDYDKSLEIDFMTLSSFRYFIEGIMEESL